MKFIMGEKLGMVRLFDAQGRAVPVTLVEAKPCTVTGVRTKERDGYDAVQFGYGSTRRTNKPEKGHFKGLGPFAAVRELRTEGPTDKKTGDAIDVSVFAEGDTVKVSGVSKAKGFQGVVKRHRFAGGPASHGQKHSLREPGSIGSTWPQRVLKGTRMGGRMGGDRRTVRNLTVMKVDKDAHVIAILGAIPGRRGGLVEIRG